MGYTKSRAQIQPCTRRNKRWIYSPSSNRFELSAGWWTRRKNAPPEAGPPLPSSASWEGSKLLQKRWTYRGAPQSEARRTFKENGVARPPSRKHKRLVEPATGTCRTTRGLLSVVRSFTGDVPQTAWGGRRQGRRSVWGGYPRRDRSATS